MSGGKHCPRIVVTAIDHSVTNIAELFTPRRERRDFFQRFKQNPKKPTGGAIEKDGKSV
ncbi:unnamed protein product [Sphenostylis stenocarpa]|uniref:Uncharacterized protein n=1 Tax=Sphenostylis stenocarpa TaxID=92480 RepID=A0AA86VBM6_9FABA|nr:unnamed protein product [Sphenostylis stenocarpa]